LFETLAARGFAIEGFNERAHGTLDFDLRDPYVAEHTRKRIGRLLARWLERRLAPWNGCVSGRLDWFAGRGVRPLEAAVVAARDEVGRRVSDHSAIVVDVAPA